MSSRQNLIFIFEDRPVSREAQTDLDGHLDQRPHMHMCMRACKRENLVKRINVHYPGSSERFRVQASMGSLPCVLEQGTIIFA